MAFDAVTFTAQLVNFLILLWLLKRFLFGPITEVMQRREQHIAERLEEAEKCRREAEQQESRFQALESELAERREQILLEARQQAARQGGEILAARRRDVDRAEVSWREGLRQEKEAFLGELRRRAAEEVLVICRRVLGDLASQDLESRVGDLIVGWLEDLDEDSLRRLQEAVEEVGGQAQVQSAFHLAEPVRGQLRRSLDDVAGVSSVVWQESPELVLGLEVRAGGWQLGWSVESYLESLSSRVGEIFEEGDLGQQSSSLSPLGEAST